MSEDAQSLTGVQQQILDLMERSRMLRAGGLWLNPAAVARNIGRSKNYTNTQLRDLYTKNLVETDGDGYYRISPSGSDAVYDL